MDIVRTIFQILIVGLAAGGIVLLFSKAPIDNSIKEIVRIACIIAFIIWALYLILGLIH